MAKPNLLGKIGKAGKVTAIAGAGIVTAGAALDQLKNGGEISQDVYDTLTGALNGAADELQGGATVVATKAAEVAVDAEFAGQMRWWDNIVSFFSDSFFGGALSDFANLFKVAGGHEPLINTSSGPVAASSLNEYTGADLKVSETAEADFRNQFTTQVNALGGDFNNPDVVADALKRIDPAMADEINAIRANVELGTLFNGIASKTAADITNAVTGMHESLRTGTATNLTTAMDGFKPAG